MKPIFKKIYTPIIECENKIQIGIDDETLEIDDESGDILKIINLLDGSRDIVDIAKLVNWSKEEVLNFINDLDAFGLLEDNEASLFTNLNDNELERYRANLNYLSSFSTLNTSKYSLQEKLKGATVLLLGLGGGSLLAASLAGMGVGKIIGLDYDSVELSNLNRQFLYSENEIGSLKTAASRDRIKAINSEIEIEVINLKVTNASCLSDIVKNVDIVVNGIDQPAIISSRWVNYACVKYNKPLIQGGVGNKKIIFQRFSSNIGGCFDCFLINSLRISDDFESQLRSVYGQSFEKRNTAFAPNVAMLTGLLSKEITNHLLELTDNNKISSTLEFDTLTYSTSLNMNWDKLDDCPTCGCKSPNGNEPVSIEEIINIAKKREVFVENGN